MSGNRLSFCDLFVILDTKIESNLVAVKDIPSCKGGQNPDLYHDSDRRGRTIALFEMRCDLSRYGWKTDNHVCDSVKSVVPSRPI